MEYWKDENLELYNIQIIRIYKVKYWIIIIISITYSLQVNKQLIRKIQFAIGPWVVLESYLIPGIVINYFY